MDAVPGPARAGRVPGRRHGPRQDADHARPSRSAVPASAPSLVLCPLSVVAQLGSRGRALRPGPERLRRCTAPIGPSASSSSQVAAEVDIVVTTYGTVTRDIDTFEHGRLGDRRLRRGPGDQEPSHQGGPRGAAPSGRPEDGPDRYTGREPAGRAVGDPRRGQSRHARWHHLVPRAIRDTHRARRRRRCRSTACAASPSPFVLRRTKADKYTGARPARQDRAVAWATLTQEQAGLYQAVLDDFLAEADAAAELAERRSDPGGATWRAAAWCWRRSPA